MKKILFPKYSKISSIVVGVLICIYFLIEILEKFNIYIYLFGLGAKEIILILTTLCAILLISGLAVLFYKNTKHKMLIIPLTLGLSFFVFSYLLINYVFSPSSEYFEYISDNQKHKIVVNEWSFLQTGGGAIYEKSSIITMKKVGSYVTDDGYCPFANDEYFFVWNENDFKLHYSFPSQSVEEYIVVIMEYAE